MRMSGEDKTPMKFLCEYLNFFAFDYWTSGASFTCGVLSLRSSKTEDRLFRLVNFF